MANSRRFDITSFGAKGNGVSDDWRAVQSAVEAAAQVDGCVYIPPGRYLLGRPLQLAVCRARLSIIGDGPNVSVLVAVTGIGAIDFEFDQDGFTQPWGLNLDGVGFRALGEAGTAIRLSYGAPDVTSDHFQPSVVLRNVVVASDKNGSWAKGIDIADAWNIDFSSVFVSGNPRGGNWNQLSGAGITLRRMCVNAHFQKVSCNFFATGFAYDAGTGPNTEGLFFTGCNFVAVKKGVHIRGNPDAGTPPGSVPRVSTFNWTGGLIEARVSNVESLSVGIHLDRIWTGLITGTQILADALPPNKLTYAVLLENCAGVVVTASDLNSWRYGVHTAGKCRAISSHGNTYTNCPEQNIFPEGTVGSRSFGHVCFNDKPMDWAHDTKLNKLGFV